MKKIKRRINTAISRGSEVLDSMTLVGERRGWGGGGGGESCKEEEEEEEVFVVRLAVVEVV